MVKPKILILIDWFIPGYKAGGPIQSCVNFCYALKDRYDIFVLTTDTDHGETDPYPNILTNTWLKDVIPGVQVNYLQKKMLNNASIANGIKAVNADYVYLNHLFSPRFVIYPLWLKWRGKIKAGVVVCPRGALYDSALAVKAYKKIPLLQLYKLLSIHKKIVFHATNEREAEAIDRFFPGSEVKIADNLPNSQQAELLSIIKQPGELKCIFISRIVPIKNLLFLLQLLPALNGKISLTIVGPIEDHQYWEQCRRAINLLPDQITVQIQGAVPNTALPALIQKHHLFISPTTGENFGHSIVEALMNGRPVLISDQTPWLNLQQQNAGWDIPLANQTRFVAAIQEMLQFNQQQFDQLASGAWNFAHTFIRKQQSITQYQQLFSQA